MGASGETEDDSAPKSAVEKPPGTPKMSARETEDMVNSMVRDSPLPDTKRSDERLPEGSGSDKLPEKEDGEKLPGRGDEKLPEETPASKLYKAFVLREYFFFALDLIK